MINASLFSDKRPTDNPVWAGAQVQPYRPKLRRAVHTWTSAIGKQVRKFPWCKQESSKFRSRVFIDQFSIQNAETMELWYRIRKRDR